MPNPYQVQRPSMGRPLHNLAGTILKYGELRQRGKEFAAGQALTLKEEAYKSRVQGLNERKFEAQYGPEGRGGMVGRGLDIRQQVADTAAGQLKVKQAEVPIHQKKLKDSDINKMVISLSMQDKQIGTKLEKDFVPLTNTMRQITAQGGNRLEVYRSVSQLWPRIKNQTIENLNKSLEVAIKEQDKEKEATISSLINDISNPGFIDSIFKNEAHAAKMQKEAMEITRLKATKAPSGQFNEPYLDTQGNLVQKNLTTGKISVLRKKETLKPSTAETPEQRGLRQTESNFKQAISQYNSAARGENIMTEAMGGQGPRVAGENFKRALTIAAIYKKQGGDPARLGVTLEMIQGAVISKVISAELGNKFSKDLFGPTVNIDQYPQYKTIDDVGKAYGSGVIKEEEAKKIMREKFGAK